MMVSLLKTANYPESLEIFQRDRRPFGTRNLIRRMSLADHSGPRLASTAPLHKPGIGVSQATVGRYLTSALQSSLPTLAQLFAESYDRHRRGRYVVVLTATFRLLYARRRG
jgi:hypothetical protein